MQMIIMKRKRYIIQTVLWALAILQTFSFSSCNDWLAVEMEDGIMEDRLFSDNDGYKAVLNGVYAKLNENYSTTLTSTVLDVMAQYYNVRKNSDHNLYVYANYTFSDDTFESVNGSVWAKQYEQIANVNNLLEHIDASDTKVAANYHDIIKGEALALRAFLHFDLLRLYGPIYSSQTADVTCIPYEESTSKDILPLLPARTVLEKIVNDLQQAVELLADDPIRTNGVMAEESSDPNETNDFRYRQFRLNYYATQVLLARAYMWMGNKEKAGSIAKQLIAENEQKEVFPWTEKSEVQRTDSPDLLFSSEVIFSLYNTKRVNVYNTYFKNTANFKDVLTFKGETFSQPEGKLPHFFTDDNDLRRGSNFWSEENLEQSTDFGGSSVQKAICLSKYADVSTTKVHRYMVPLIRMSEVYLMAAECADDLNEAIYFINQLRVNRNCVNIELSDNDTKETVQQYITNEFIREMICEGQTYFYYKRLGLSKVLSGTTFEEDWWSGKWVITDNINMQDYVWPLPKVEKDKRITE